MTFIEPDLRLPRVNLHFIGGWNRFGRPIKQIQIGIDPDLGRFQAAVAFRVQIYLHMPVDSNLAERVAQQLHHTIGFQNPGLLHSGIGKVNFAGGKIHIVMDFP